MTSEWRRAANRRNARLSTGPKSAEGKAVAARNSVKHGFYANWEENAQEDPVLEERRLAFVERFGRGDPWAEELASRAFWAHRRAHKLHLLEEFRSSRYQAEAPTRIDLEEQAEVEEADARLLENPRDSLVRLSASSLGCERLHLRLDALEAAVAESRWNEDCHRVLRALHGSGEEDPMPELKAKSDLMIRLQTHDNRVLVAPISGRLSAVIQALRAGVDGRLAELEQSEPRLRSLAVGASLVDTTPTGLALLRAIAQAENQAFRLLKELEQYAKSGGCPPAGTMKKAVFHPEPIPPATSPFTAASVPSPTGQQIEIGAAVREDRSAGTERVDTAMPPVSPPRLAVPASMSATSSVPCLSLTSALAPRPEMEQNEAKGIQGVSADLTDSVALYEAGSAEARRRRPPSPMEKKKKRR